MERTRLALGDLVFDALTAGPPEGRLVLLLHGFPQNSTSWQHVWPGLAAAGYRVVAPDQRGYSPGARPSAVANYRMPELVADVLGLVDQLGAGRADVVGHDWGAGVAWQVASRHPDRVRSLAAVSVPHPLAFAEALRTDPDQREKSRYMRLFQQPGTAEAALLADGGMDDLFGVCPPETRGYLERMRAPGALTAALNWYRAMDRATVEGLRPVRVPTLHVWGDADPALGESATRASAVHVAAPYRLEVLAGVGHWVPELAPELLTALLLDHLEAT